MFMSVNSLYFHIIHIDLYVPPNLVGEHNIDESMVGGANILEAERHDVVVVKMI